MMMMMTHLPRGRPSPAGVPGVSGLRGPAQPGTGVLGHRVRSAASVLLTSRPRMNTPVFPRRGGSLRVRGLAPHRDMSEVSDGESKLCVFLSCCLLEEEEEEGGKLGEEGEVNLGEEWLAMGEQTSRRSDSS